MASTTIVRLAGRSFVAGLFWCPLSSSGRSISQEIKALAAEQGAVWAVSRGALARQVGLAPELTGLRAGMPSIAGSVAARLTRDGLRNFIIVLRAAEEDRWVYIAQRDGLLLHDGDRVGSELDVRDWLAADIVDLADWQLIVAPDAWDIRGAQERDWASLLPRASLLSAQGDLPRLRRVASSGPRHASNWSLLVVALVLSLGTEAGIGYYQHRKLARELDDIRRQGDDEHAAYLASVPWMGKPTLSAGGRECLVLMAGHLVETGAWQVRKIDCDPTGRRLSIKWERNTDSGAIASDLLARYPMARVIAEGERMRAEASLSMPPATPEPPTRRAELMSKQRWDRDVADWTAWLLGVRFKLVTGADGPSHAEVAWEAVTDDLPLHVISVMGHRGSVVSKVEANVNDGRARWTIYAKQYLAK